VKIAVCKDLTAFDAQTVGTKITDATEFMRALTEAIAAYNFEAEDASRGVSTGQAVLILSDAANCVSCGIGCHTHNPADYVIRKYQGKVRLFLKREKAELPLGVAALVFTRDRYLSDLRLPADEEEFSRISAVSADFVLVNVLGMSGPSQPLSYEDFVKDLSKKQKGNLLEASTVDALVRSAEYLAEYHEMFCVVAD
jgi:hypothetical protein